MDSIMISDVLSEVIPEIDNYLNEEVFKKCYEGELRTAITELRDQAKAIMVTLDTFPGASPKNRLEQDAHLAKVMTASEYAAWKALQIRLGYAPSAASLVNKNSHLGGIHHA
jgi:hypothetical protein